MNINELLEDIKNSKKTDFINIIKCNKEEGTKTEEEFFKQLKCLLYQDYLNENGEILYNAMISKYKKLNINFYEV